MRMVIEQSAEAAEDPAELAALLVATAEAEDLESFRVIVGEGGKVFADGRAKLSDRDVLRMAGAETDEEYFALFAQAYAPSE